MLTTAELAGLRETTRRFVAEEFEPRWQDIEAADEIPAELLERAGSLGLFGTNLPSEYGGSDLGEVGVCVVLEELAKTNACLSQVVTPSMPATLLASDGTEKQRNQFLPGLATGEQIAALCMSEPDTGSDASGITTRARPEGDGYVLNGSKTYITRARLASIFLVTAVVKDEDGQGHVGLFLVPNGSKGLTVGEPLHFMGQRSSGTAEVFVEDCFVPRDMVLGEVGNGFTLMKKVLASARLWIAAKAIGAATTALDRATEYARTRVQFGQPIGAFQMVQQQIADSHAKLAVMQRYVSSVAEQSERGENISMESSICKLMATEFASDVADKAIQIHGAFGYTSEAGIERFARDLRAYRILEGSSEIQRRIIALKKLRLPAAGDQAVSGPTQTAISRP